MTPEEFSADLSVCGPGKATLSFAAHIVRWKLRKNTARMLFRPWSHPAHLSAILGTGVGNIYDLLGVTETKAAASCYRTAQEEKSRPEGMVKYGEGFFTSMGFAPLPRLSGSGRYSPNPPIRCSLPRQRLDIDNKTISA